MSTNFDKILKKGKDAASVNAAPVNKWQQFIGIILHTLQQFNKDFYSDDKTHHIATKHIRCKNCKAAGFIILARDEKDSNKLLKFHLPTWKSVDPDNDEYLCDRCKV
jgi:adenine-specific DNA methylase